MKIFKLFIDENIKTWKKLSTKIMIIAIILSLFAVLALVKFMEKTEENLLVYNSDNSTGENEKEFLEREIEFYESQLKNEKLDAKLILQVHDELIVEASESDSAKAAKVLSEEMQNAAKLAVPLTADVNTGKSWYDAKD